MNVFDTYKDKSYQELLKMASDLQHKIAGATNPHQRLIIHDHLVIIGNELKSREDEKFDK